MSPARCLLGVAQGRDRDPGTEKRQPERTKKTSTPGYPRATKARVVSTPAGTFYSVCIANTGNAAGARMAVRGDRYRDALNVYAAGSLIPAARRRRRKPSSTGQLRGSPLRSRARRLRRQPQGRRRARTRRTGPVDLSYEPSFESSDPSHYCRSQRGSCWRVRFPPFVSIPPL
jgi:hypothetical protein